MHRLKTSVNREGESKGIWRIKCLRLWMSQSWFFLGFLSQNSLWKLSTFNGYKGIYSSVREECQKSFFYKIGHSSNSLSSGMSCEIELRVNCQARLSIFVLQCSSCCDPLASYMLRMCGILASRQSQVTHEIQYRESSECSLEFFTLFSHTTLTLFPPKYRVSNY